MGITMPSLAPAIGDFLAARLTTLGVRIREHRKALRISATDAAEAAGMSRVTLHRIERGEASVAMAAYFSATAALGLELQVVTPPERTRGGRVDPIAPSAPPASPTLPATIRLADYPQLERLVWQQHGLVEVSPAEALSLYERNWRHVDLQSMDLHEHALVKALARELSAGRLLV